MSQQRKSNVREERLKRKIWRRSQFYQVHYVPRALKFVWQAAHGWALFSTVLLVIRGLLPAVTVYLTKEMVNSLAAVLETHGDVETLLDAVPFIALIAATILLRELIGDVQSYVRAVMSDKTHDFMDDLIHNQTTSLDMQFYESSSYFDKLQRAASEAAGRPLSLLGSINSLLEGMVTLTAMIGILFTLSWWIPLLLIVGTLPAFYVALRTTRIRQKWRLENTVERRRLKYYKRVLTDDRAVPEMRVFELGGHFKERYSHLRRRLRDEALALHRRGLWEKGGASLLGLGGLAVMLAWLAWSAFKGLLDVGEIVMFWQAMNQGRGLVRRLFFGFDTLYNDLIFLDDLFKFLELEPQVVDPEEPVDVPPGLNRSIELKDVTFSYPESNMTALENFNLTITRGQVVAVVGENGAGKSTLVKMLCRFYDPQQGSITWDGVDYKDMAQADLRRRITVLFQTPLSYYESAANNIRFGDLPGQPTQEEVIHAAKGSGAHAFISKLPDGYDTMLGKRFGTAELSVGEWQRVALARAFVRNADFVILDEPTSAMDSWAEIAWIKRFSDLVNRRTALIITHRFTTAMKADIIHVMVDGKIVETGTHAELLARNGRYAQSWRQQMQENNKKIKDSLPDSLS